MTFEITTVYLGMTSTWEVQAKSAKDARRVAKIQMDRDGVRATILAVKAIGYKPMGQI